MSIIDEINQSDKSRREEFQKSRELRRQQIRAISKKIFPRSQRRGTATPAINWLKSLICPLVYGEATDNGVRPSVTKEQLLAGNFRGKLSNYRILDHIANKETYYYFGAGKPSTRYTLVMIDVDVLKALGKGSIEGGKRFIQYLKTWFPDLYVEPSTKGKGQHGYFLLDKYGCDASRVNAALKKFQGWLRWIAECCMADIETVEIKGTCPIVAWDYGRMNVVKYGQFAKLPRDIDALYRGTTILNIKDLEGSKYAVPATTDEISITKENVWTGGSSSGKCITLDEIERYAELYGAIAPQGIECKGEWKVTAQDVGIAMAILRHCKADPNINGSLPTRRAEELWKALKQSGDIDRGWVHQRWTAIRNHLSLLGHIEWKDHRYEAATIIDGRMTGGTACRWSITQELDDWLKSVIQGETSSVYSNFPSPGPGRNLRPQYHPFRQERERLFALNWCRAEETLWAA